MENIFLIEQLHVGNGQISEALLHCYVDTGLLIVLDVVQLVFAVFLNTMLGETSLTLFKQFAMLNNVLLLRFMQY